MFHFNLAGCSLQDAEFGLPACQELYRYLSLYIYYIHIIRHMKRVNKFLSLASGPGNRSKKRKGKDSDPKIPENILGIIFINLSKL